jgi:anaerobic ribonucleoside-triphosphate reductase
MFQNPDKIPVTFIRHAADILGETVSGLSGTKIIEATATYAVEYNKPIPHTSMSI